MKSYSFIYITIALMAAACSEGEKAEGVQARETAEQMQDAEFADPAILARREARKIVARQWHDTIELKQTMLQADSLRLEYIKKGHPDYADCYDSVYTNTIRAIRPQLLRYKPESPDVK